MLALLCCSDQEVEEGPQKKKPRVDPFVDLRDGGSHATSTAPSQSSLSVTEQSARYKALRVSAASGSPLQYWKEQMNEYPVLSQVARRLLCISASSAQSERDFSSVGHTITDARSRLSASKVEAIELVRWGLRAGLLD